MTRAFVEMREDIVRILSDFKVPDYEFGVDGSGHQVVRFNYAGQPMLYHFPKTGRMNGRGRKNQQARLRRILREKGQTLQ